MLPPLIRSVSYEAPSKVLTIAFQVGRYEYHGVPQDRGEALVAMVQHRAEEPGCELRYFETKIEGKYKSVRVGT